MSILIKGMKMPKNCWECPLVSGFQLWHDGAEKPRVDARLCRIRRKMKYKPTEEQPDWCPLIELPPHGRLIDADALHIQLIDKELDQLQPWISFDDYREIVQMIDDAPTIIESEGENA